MWPASSAEAGTRAIDLTNSYYTTPGPLYIGNSGPGVGANGIAYFDNLLVTDGVATIDGFYPGDYPGLNEYPGGANTTSGSIAFSTAMEVSLSGTVSRLGAMALNTVSSLLISSPQTVRGNLPLGGSMGLTIGDGSIDKFGQVEFASGSNLFLEGQQETPGWDLILSTEFILFIHSPVVAAPDPGPDGTYGGGPYGAGPYGGGADLAGTSVPRRCAAAPAADCSSATSSPRPRRKPLPTSSYSYAFTGPTTQVTYATSPPPRHGRPSRLRRTRL